MTGGLIQLVSSGKEDSYLTFKPQITYFRKIYRRHTIFGTELIQTLPEQQPEYDNRVSFRLNNISDIISKCYIEIELPSLSFNESSTVISLKNNDLNNIKKNINKWKTLYENLKKFCTIEILLYQTLNKLLDSININLNILKQNVIKFNSKYKSSKDQLINSIFDDVYVKINLTGYILQLQKAIVADDYADYNENLHIRISDLKAEIKTYFDNMCSNLKYYHSNWKFYQKNYDDLNNNNVKFAWIENLAHYFFTNFQVEIGGQVVEEYSAEQSYIYQMHHLKEEYMGNYDQMIGNNENLTTFNNQKKNKQTLILPLNFWFCKDTGCSLPTVALSNSSVNINLKLNKLKNLLYFQDYETDYYNMIRISTPANSTINDNLNVETFEYDVDSKIINYICKNVNYQLLALKYPSLSKIDKNDVLTTILQTYGKMVDGEYIMELSEWIVYKKNFTSTQDIMNVLNRDSLNNFNEYYSLVDKPSIKLITESIYLDDLERTKFSSSRLEYVVEIFQENVFDLDNTILFNGELSLDRPTKEIMWTTQPKIFLNGLSEFGKSYNLFDYKKFFTNEIYSSYNILLNQMQLTKPKLNSVFYNELQSYKYYNNILPEGVNAYNFGLFPEEIQPSGTANFTMLKGKLLNFNLNTAFINEYFNTSINPNMLGLLLKFYSRGYNFFVVEKGMGQIVFSN